MPIDGGDGYTYARREKASIALLAINEMLQFAVVSITEMQTY